MSAPDGYREIRIGKFIRDQRKARGMSQDTFSSEVDINRKTLHKIELGERLPSGKEIFDICAFLKITPNDLLSANGHVSIEPEGGDLRDLQAAEISQFFQLIYAFFKLSEKDKNIVSDLVVRMVKTDLEGRHLNEFVETLEMIDSRVSEGLVWADEKLDDDLWKHIAELTDGKVSSFTNLAHVFVGAVNSGDLSLLRNVLIAVGKGFKNAGIDPYTAGYEVGYEITNGQHDSTQVKE